MPGDEKLTKVVQISKTGPDVRVHEMQQHIGADRVELWPKQHQLKQIKFDDEHIYEFDLWVDEEGGPYCNNRTYNRCATITAHPLGEVLGWFVYGPALLVRKGKKDLDEEDWKKITRATYYDHKLVQMNIDDDKKKKVDA